MRSESEHVVLAIILFELGIENPSKHLYLYVLSSNVKINYCTNNFLTINFSFDENSSFSTKNQKQSSEGDCQLNNPE